MKIALISDCYAPRLGGIESQVHDLACHLTEAGHDVIVVTATPAGAWGKKAVEIHDGIKVLRLAAPIPGKLPVNPAAGPDLRAVMEGADVVHIHTGVVSPFAQHAILLATGMDTPTTVTWHCMLNHAHWLFRLLPFMQRAARSGIAMNTVSELMATQIGDVLADSGDVTVLYNGIDLSQWTQVAQQRTTRGARIPTDDAPLRIVSSRRLARRKRNDVLIKIAAQAQENTGVPCQLEIYGEGPQRGYLNRLITFLDVPWVKLPGRLSRIELQQAYRDADIYFSTSLMDSFGIATLEARTAGVPIVAPVNTGVDDFATDGVNGIFGRGNDGLRVALETLMVDHERRAEIASVNATTVPEQDWESVIAATLAEYDRARELRS